MPGPGGKGKRLKEPLSITHPQLAAEWHPTKNGDLRPDQVYAGSDKKVWWLCRGGHEWQARIANRKHERGCPYCAGRKISDTNSLVALFPDLAVEWHPTKNGELTPDQVVAGSARKVWWQCPKFPNH